MGQNVTVRSYRKEREAEIVNGLQKSLEKVGQIVERQAKMNVTSPLPSGKIHSEKERQDTNHLAATTIHVVTQGQVEIGTNTKYGKYLEHGTSKMLPYPWLFPAVELKRPEIIEALKGKFTYEAGYSIETE